MTFHSQSKRIFIWIFLLFFTALFSQEDSLVVSKKLKGGIKMGTFKAIPIGDNFLGSGHKSQGLGLDASLAIPVFSRGFGLGGGIQFSSFEAVDPEMVGDISGSNVTFYSLQLFYQHAVGRKLFFEYTLGGGPQKVQSRRLSITPSWGNAYKAGIIIKYAKVDHFGFYGGINWISGFHSAETPQEVKSYFEQNHQLQLSLGVSF